MRVVILALAMVMSLVNVASAESIDIGPKVGESIPAPFVVRDAAGTEKTLADLTGSAGVVLVFVRSASWCPYCMQQLKDIQAIAGPLEKRGYRLASVSYDAPEVLAKFAEKYGVSYALLSDQGSKMIDAFGIRDPQYKENSRAYGVPMPGIFIVDGKGVVRAKLAEEGYKTRPPAEAIIAAVDAVAAH
jgi:peroxiredoxin